MKTELFLKEAGVLRKKNYGVITIITNERKTRRKKKKKKKKEGGRRVAAWL